VEVGYVERSPELEAMARRRFDAWNTRDVETLCNLYADEPALLVIGTDPDEWWCGAPAIRTMLEVHTPELHAISATMDIDHIEAWAHGNVGWIACRLTMHSNNASTPMRYTGVLILDRGVWKFIQAHLSQGAANEEAWGATLTSTVEQLADAARVELLDLSDTAALDGTVTVAFSDIESSTRLALRLGDHKWFDLLRWHDRVVTDRTTQQGGRVVKSLGDGHMLAFSSASHALRAAIDILRALQQSDHRDELRVRIGLHTGEVVQSADDFFGTAVNTAARVAAAADGNEILASSLVHELTRNLGSFQFGEPRVAQLKGLPGEHRLFPVTWADAS
jgi:adenylate cyclase